ncbi:MAG: 16S rRNA (cytosine(1402)-N(4))-methyltransferase RsmH [Planctomycetota bacterium]
MSDDVGHVPVLLGEVLELLGPALRPGAVVVDGTAGRGGHAAALAERVGPGGTVVAVDLDPGNAAYAEARLAEVGQRCGVRVVVAHASFAELNDVCAEAGLDGADGFADAVLADLGFASNQMDDPVRGLSFSAEGPLDMRLDPTADRGVSPTAADLVNELPQNELADLIYELGEERMSRRIARKIVEERAAGPIETTAQLARVVRRAVGPRGGSRMDPATRTFMALRIAVNDELTALDRLLGQTLGLLRPGGRMGVISFHSLEDRRVKHAWRERVDRGELAAVTRKPVTPGLAECDANPRARSAKLRVVERIGHEA